MSDQFDELEQFGRENLDPLPQDQRPIIYVPGGGVSIRDTARCIYECAANQGTLYYHNGSIVRLIHSHHGAGMEMQVLKPAAARSEFEKYGRLMSKGEKKDRDATLSESDAKALLESDVAAESLPKLKAVLDTPLPILRDGKVEVLVPGYNEREQYFVTGGAIREPDSLEDAVTIIKSLLLDFNFETESDESRAIAFMLTPALKLGGFITGSTPFDVIEANESQTGKGYLANLRTSLYGQSPISISQQKGGVGSLDERLASSLLKGKPFILIDNYRGELNSQNLESLITNKGLFSVRVPHFGEQYIDGTVFFIAVTSNGMNTTEDLANRSSFIRLVKVPDQEFAAVNDQSIDEFVASKRPLYLGAITKVIRHWVEQGMPRTAEKRHSFHSWAQPLDWIVQNIFELPPLIDGNQEAQERMQNPGLTFARLLAIEIEKANGLGIPYKAAELAEICVQNGVEIPGVGQKQGFDPLAEHFKRIGTLLGTAFGTANELTVAPYRITRQVERTKNFSANPQENKTYVFTKPESAQPEEPKAEPGDRVPSNQRE